MPGTWEDLVSPWPADVTPNGLRAVHMVHLKMGKILLWSGGAPDPPFNIVARLWDPDNPTVSEAANNNTTNLFCAGHCALSDGTTLVAGGSWYAANVPWLPPDDVNFFAPDDASPWRSTPLHMEFRRWYPTCTMLWDERVLITSGYKSWTPTNSPPQVYANLLEIYDPADDSLTTLTPSNNQLVYAMMFVVPNGKLVHVGPSRYLDILKPGDPWVWDLNIELSNRAGMFHGSSVMYDAVDGLILKSGGAPTETEDGSKLTALFKYDKWIAVPPAKPTFWKDGPDMVHARRNHDLVMLPDGTVLCVGGNLKGNDATTQEVGAVLEAEIYDPAANTWTGTVVTMTDPRWYHSTALLMAMHAS